MLDSGQVDEKLWGLSGARNFAVAARDEQTIKIQLRALGLIEQSKKTRSVKDTRTFWSLTPYGDAVLVQFRAIRKGEFNPEEHDESSAEAET